MTLDYKKIAKLKVQEVMKDLPVKLKDPKCYKPIETKLAKVMFSDHQHKTIAGFQKCKRCVAKMEKKRKIIAEEGFKSYPQYLGWKRIMDIIVNERPITISNKFIK